MTLFSKMPPIPRKDELLSKAFQRARKVKKTIDKRDRINSIREYEQNKISTVSAVISVSIDNILEKTPKIDTLDPFHKHLVELVIDADQFKKSLAALKWAARFNKDICHKYRRRLKGTPLKSLAPVRKECYGRVSSILKQVKKDFIFLEDCRNILKKLPTLKNLPTVVLAGYPNVGKSSLLKCLTGAEPAVQAYPFTTKKILLGYIDEKIQVIDTPGLLDRPIEQKNKIEMQAMLALQYRANLIIYLIDPTETCGYTIEQQKSLYEDIKSSFEETQILLCETKYDLRPRKIKQKKSLTKDTPYFLSSKTNEGIDSLKKRLLRSIDWKTYSFKPISFKSPPRHK